MAMKVAPSGSLGTRMIRAARMDPALYRAVAGGGTRQAALVVFVAAFSSHLAIGTIRETSWLISQEANAGAGTALLRIAGQAVGAVFLGIFAVLAAWPVWAAGLRFVGLRVTKRKGGPFRFGQISRAIAFAQAPAAVGLLAPVLLFGYVVTPGLGDSIPSLLLRLLVALRILVGLWVVIATIVALREALGVSSARALGALALVAVGLTLLLPVAAVIVVLLAGLAIEDGNSVRLLALQMHTIAEWFDFNLGFDLASQSTYFAATTVEESIR